MSYFIKYIKAESLTETVSPDAHVDVVLLHRLIGLIYGTNERHSFDLWASVNFLPAPEERMTDEA